MGLGVHGAFTVRSEDLWMHPKESAQVEKGRGFARRAVKLRQKLGAPKDFVLGCYRVGNSQQIYCLQLGKVPFERKAKGLRWI